MKSGDRALRTHESFPDTAAAARALAWLLLSGVGNSIVRRGWALLRDDPG